MAFPRVEGAGEGQRALRARGPRRAVAILLQRRRLRRQAHADRAGRGPGARDPRRGPRVDGAGALYHRSAEREPVCRQVWLRGGVKDRVVELAQYREDLFAYLQERMHSVAPNLSALIGEVVGARLIAHSGSLVSLAKCPASTIQILGAEKALFRALKTRSSTPKYGIIFHSSFIGRAGAKNKGRISRYLANKCSIASRLDSFAEEPTELYGLKMKEQVEQRLNFYETGVPPQKNLDAMMEVAEDLKKEKKMEEEKKEDKEKKDKKDKKEKKEKKDKKDKKDKKEKKDKKDKKKEKKE